MPKANTEGEMTYGDISTSSSIKIDKDLIVKKLIQIKDPELGINIYDLGLIYDVKIDEFNNVKITMTLPQLIVPWQIFSIGYCQKILMKLMVWGSCC